MPTMVENVGLNETPLGAVEPGIPIDLTIHPARSTSHHIRSALPKTDKQSKNLNLTKPVQTRRAGDFQGESVHAFLEVTPGPGVGAGA